MSRVLAKVTFQLPEGASDLSVKLGNQNSLIVHPSYYSEEYYSVLLEYKLEGVHHFLLCSGEYLHDKNGENFLYITPRKH